MRRHMVLIRRLLVVSLVALGAHAWRPADAAPAIEATPPAVAAGDTTAGKDAPTPGEASPATGQATSPETGGPVEPAAPAAAPGTTPAITVDPEAEARLTSWRAALEQVTASLERADLDDETLDSLRQQATDVRDEANAVSLTLAPRIKAAEVRLEQLAKPADEAEVESDLVRQDRELETRSLAALRAIDQQAQVARLRAGELIDQINERRRTLFTERLFERRVSIIDPKLWVSVAAEIPRAFTSARLLANDWASATIARAGRSAMALILLVTVGGVVVYFGLRHHLVRIAARAVQADVEVPALKKVVGATAIVLVNTGIPVIGMLLLWFTLDTMDILPFRVGRVLRGLTIAIGSFAFAFGLSRALFAPGRPRWRLIPIPEEAIDPAIRWILLGSGIFAIGVALINMAAVLALPVTVIVAVQSVVAVTTAIVTGMLLRLLSSGFAVGEEEADGGVGGAWLWLIPIGWLIVVATVVSALVGYLALAWFFATQIIWTATVLATLRLLLDLVDESITAGFQSGTRVGRFLAGNFGLSYSAIGQLGVLLSGALRLMLIAFATLSIVARLGISSSDLTSVTDTIVSGLTFGGITLSPMAIVGAIALFGLGVAATRSLQHWLDQRFLPRTHMDVGLKTSIRTGVGYVGTIAAGMAAFSIAGLNLQNIAIVAGALSVGIGFGLQSVVNNFVSGLILLAERPIKVGDWIVVGTDEGVVKRINVRSTEIETFDRATVIVPNSSLISGTVKNWMHHDLTGRIMLPVGVGYDSDPEQVIAILLDCARAHPQVLTYPQPFAQFMNFGASSLDFMLFCYVPNVGTMGGVRSDLRVEILKAFRAAGIDIPFAQSDVNIRGFDRIEAAVREFLLKQPESEPPAGGAASSDGAKPSGGA